MKNKIIGIIAGLISGLFGAGGTSILCILPLVATSFFLYFKNRYIDWNIGIKCAIGGIIGSVIGTILLRKLDDKILKILFTIFLIYSSIKMVI